MSTEIKTMKKDDILTELLALRARVDDVIERVRSGEDEPARPTPIYMKIDEFCKRWDMSRRTFYSRVGEGLPTVGEGHDRRVKVTDGDEFMARRIGRRAP